jgi:phosphoesterase RecJ-like protein
MIEQIKEIVAGAQRIVVLQADNPDADSLGSALALEQILSEQGKDVYLYCAVETPTYLRHLTGWSRVNQEIPSNFDASIIVDASTMTLFEKLTASGQQGWVAAKPCIVLDHHETSDNSINFATVILNEPNKSSTGEVIYDLSQSLGWALDAVSGSSIMSSILGDTQGLTNSLTTAQTYRIMAALTDLGVNRAILEEQRRESSKMAQVIFKYKAELMARTEFHADGKLALVTIPQAEINQYSPLYNPGPLVQPDMLNTEGVLIGVVIKTYDDGKITGMIRCNPKAEIAGKLAKHFGGGGHGFAAGFKIVDGRSFSEVKSECIAYTTELLQGTPQ